MHEKDIQIGQMAVYLCMFVYPYTIRELHLWGFFVYNEVFAINIWSLITISCVPYGPSGWPIRQRLPMYRLRLSRALTLTPIKPQPRVRAEVLCESFISFNSIANKVSRGGDY